MIALLNAENFSGEKLRCAASFSSSALKSLGAFRRARCHRLDLFHVEGNKIPFAHVGDRLV